MSDVLAGGRYTVVRRLATGGMGEVLLADFPGDTTLGLSKGLVVVKRVLAEHPNHSHQATMLREEGRISLRLLHDNLVETFFVDEHDGDPLLVMEFMSGRAMSQVLGQAKKRKEHVPVDVALAILRAAACGLHFAHTLTDGSNAARPLGLIHRDVSPANIFVTFDGRAKVIDFGVAKADDSEIRTSTGILKGKLGYMSPEHAMGLQLTAAADLWSLGVCFWETLCAERLFAMASPSATLQAIAEKPIPSPLTHRPDLPPHIVELVMWLLERRLEQRIASGAALVKAIDALPEAPSLRRVDLGGWLSGRFPEEAEQGSSEAARCARLRRRTPVPIGLVEGRAAQAPSDGDAPTIVMSSAGVLLGRAADDDVGGATIRIHSDAISSEDAPTKKGVRPGGLLADKEESLIGALPSGVVFLGTPLPNADQTLGNGDDEEGSTLPLPAPRPLAPGAADQRARTSSPGRPSPPSSPVAPRARTVTGGTASLSAAGSSWVAVALLTFGALAVVMGLGFSFLAPRPLVRTVAAFPDPTGAFDIVVATADAPPGARLVELSSATLTVNGETRVVAPDELAARLATSGVAVRAALPVSDRGKLALLLPVSIAGLGLLALALAVPALLLASRGMRTLAQIVLLSASVASIAFAVERGALSWPGLEAWRNAPRLEMR